MDDAEHGVTPSVNRTIRVRPLGYAALTTVALRVSFQASRKGLADEARFDLPSNLSAWQTLFGTQPSRLHDTAGLWAEQSNRYRYFTIAVTADFPIPGGENSSKKPVITFSTTSAPRPKYPLSIALGTAAPVTPTRPTTVFFP
ncbi:hypothetical protein FRB93_001700 [Tulasnella sp. JGI-2019a]|nr:hypothetical protein FRB93_001700 [Tulasnella sp. JGI-2019a]